MSNLNNLVYANAIYEHFSLCLIYLVQSMHTEMQKSLYSNEKDTKLVSDVCRIEEHDVKIKQLGIALADLST